MRPPFVPGLQQSRLDAGTATTWRFDRATVLSVQQGRVWITVDGEASDWFLDVGMAMRVAARQRLVLEAAGRRGEAAMVAVYAEAVPLAGAVQTLGRRLASQVEALGQGQKRLKGSVTVQCP